MALCCEQMQGWDYNTYMAQPDFFIEELFAKWAIDAEKQKQDELEAKVKGQSKLKK